MKPVPRTKPAVIPSALLVLSVLPAAAGCGKDDIAGTATETVTGKTTGLAHLADGKLAVDARVRVFSVGYRPAQDSGFSLPSAQLRMPRGGIFWNRSPRANTTSSANWTASPPSRIPPSSPVPPGPCRRTPWMNRASCADSIFLNDSPVNSQRMQVFDPSSDKWSEGWPLLTPGQPYFFAAAGGKLIRIGAVGDGAGIPEQPLLVETLDITE